MHETDTFLDLEPPAEPRPLLERAADWNVKLEYDKGGGWYLLNAKGDDYSEYLYLDYLQNDSSLRLTGRDREAATRLFEEATSADYLYLDPSVWEDRLGWYSEGSTAGPAIDVKMHNMWKYENMLEKALNWEIPPEHEVDPEAVIWRDTIDWEIEYFIEWVKSDGRFDGLDADKLIRCGRQGGHMVYDCRAYDQVSLSLAEAEALEALWPEVPQFVEGACQTMVVQLASYALAENTERIWNKWERREHRRLSKALRANDYTKAKWHQDNIDAADGCYWREEVEIRIEAEEELWSILHDATEKEK